MADVQTNDYKLMRARKGRMIAGVAAGLAKSSGLDVTVVRLCIGATMISGLGIAAYILMWIVIPEESPKRGRVVEPAPDSTARIIRITLFTLAALSVVNKVGGFSPFTTPNSGGMGLDGLFGLILLGIGVFVLFSRHRPDRNWWEPTSPPSSATTPSRRPPAPADDDFTTAYAEAAATRPGRTATAEYYFDDYEEYADEEYADEEVDDAFDAARPRVAMVTAAGLQRSGGAALAWARVVGWLLLIWFTVAGLAMTALWFMGATSVRAPAILAGVSWLVWTAVTNTLLHAKFARAIIPSLALLLIPVAIGTASTRFVGGVGETVVDPAIVGQDKSYRAAVGRLDLDFGDTKFLDRNTTINGRTGVGAIFVTVPDDAAVTVSARNGVGATSLFGAEANRRGRATRSYEGCEGGPNLKLILRTGAGYIEVVRSNGQAEARCPA